MTIFRAIVAFAEAQPDRARAIIDEAIGKETEPDEVARLEVLREYLTNPQFRSRLEAHSFSATHGA